MSDLALNIEVFKALCWARATLWRLGEWEWIDQAVDPLQEWADQHGVDPELAQEIIAAEQWEDDNG